MELRVHDLYPTGPTTRGRVITVFWRGLDEGPCRVSSRRLHPDAQTLTPVERLPDPGRRSLAGALPEGGDGHAYVLDDLSGKYQPHEWAAKAIAAYHQHNADRIIAEVNQGGAMVESTIRVIDPKVPFKGVHASRGKVTRAEPVAALYEQKRIHHVGSFSELEDQLCSFTSDFDRSRAGYSPDRLDALCWALTELMLGKTQRPINFAALASHTGPIEIVGSRCDSACAAWPPLWCR